MEWTGFKKNAAARVAIGAFLLLTILGCRQEYLITGKTMGTTYSVKVVSGRHKNMTDVKKRIDERLEQINDSMSTYRKDSEISRFNNSAQPGEPFGISTDLKNVMLVALKVYDMSSGAWDGTVNPLVNLWGFGKDGVIDHMPSAEAVKTALLKVGFQRIQVSDTGFLIRQTEETTLDLASIAKGYGVDQVATLLRGLGYSDFLVEIGGEVNAAGRRVDGKQWRVGINRPSSLAAPDDVYEVVAIEDMAMATSGDYRNFYQIGDRHFSHIIDPRTGYPVENGVVSASVLTDNCTLADGLATALMVMGPQKGVALLNGLSGVYGVIIVRHKDGRLENFLSDGMAGFIQ